MSRSISTKDEMRRKQLQGLPPPGSNSFKLTCRSHVRANERQTSKRDRDVIDENIYSLCRSCGTPSCRQFSFTLALSHGRNVLRIRSIPMSQRSVYADQSRRRCCGLLVEHVKRRVTYLNSLSANLFVVAALDVILFLRPHGCAKSMLDVLFRVFSGGYSASCCGSRSKLECLKSITVVRRRAADYSRNFANPVELAFSGLLCNLNCVCW